MQIKNILSLMLCLLTSVGSSSAKITDHTVGISAFATWLLHASYETNHAWGKAAAHFATEQKKSSESTMADAIEELTFFDFITSPQMMKKNIRWKRLLTSGLLAGVIALGENHSRNKGKSSNTPGSGNQSTNQTRVTPDSTDQRNFIPDPQDSSDSEEDQQQIPPLPIEELSKRLSGETVIMKLAGDQLYNLYTEGKLPVQDITTERQKRTITGSKHFQAASRLCQFEALNLTESRYRLVNNMPPRKARESSAIKDGAFHTMVNLATTIAIKTMEAREKDGLLPVAQPKEGADQSEIEAYEIFKTEFMKEFYENLNTVVTVMIQGGSYLDALTFVFEE